MSLLLGSQFCSIDWYMSLCQYHDEACNLEKYGALQIAKNSKETWVQDSKMRVFLFPSVPTVGSVTVYVTPWGDDTQSPHLHNLDWANVPPRPHGTESDNAWAPLKTRKVTRSWFHLWKVLAKVSSSPRPGTNSVHEPGHLSSGEPQNLMPSVSIHQTRGLFWGSEVEIQVWEKQAATLIGLGSTECWTHVKYFLCVEPYLTGL